MALFSSLLSLSTTTRFILIETHHAGNVGATARAMKTMGFSDLVLVNPRDRKVLNRVRTKESASGALDVLENTQIFDSLEAALAEDTEGRSTQTSVICGTGMPHDMYRTRPEREYCSPREYFQKLLDGQVSGDSLNSMNNKGLHVTLLFGNEKRGMKEEDMDRASVVLGIPTNPLFGSLNLASAVQLIAYDWREALGGF